MRAPIRATTLACVSLAVSISGAVPLARGADRSPARAESFELYCAGCHALGDGGGRQGVPDLSDLARKYGTPLPRARLVAFVTSDHRLGGARICGENVFEKIPAPRFGNLAERGNVRAALEFVEAAQRAK